MNDNRNQYTNNYMIEFKQGQELIMESAQPVEPEWIDTHDSIGRVLFSDIHSPSSLPPFNNSAMDGYAVNAADLLNASPDSPVTLLLSGVTAAGDESNEISDSQGKACKIMTGAPVAGGFDSIIPVENTQLDGNNVICFSCVDQGAHIRKIGEDFIEGETVASKGEVINTNVITGLIAIGVPKVQVYKRVRVSVFSTGKELVDDLNTPLKPGQIRNSNKPFILNWLSNLPVECIDAGTNYDEVGKFESDLKRELELGSKIIISSGAVSMGDFDFIPQTIIKLGGTIVFHKNRIKPGKPILFATFPNGSFYFGLPGNPISAAIGLRFYVSTLLRTILGQPPEMPLKAIASNNMNKKQGFRSIWKASAEVDSAASLQVKILDGQESFKLKPLMRSNGWVMIDENKVSVKPGDVIDFYPSKLTWQ
ncbi:molybdopterin molybdotransferase MoeA [Aliikangiella sp. G2MR2-5]|uniref:molybdopterin molybdotransferase MoeA n=1 Tax=Aliikangiella sp. G2MR2-5 TaxID=2788943 RepID=UPI0018AC4FCE|nr:molybdopterin molybdotransferase MoeA [Aliikangiella sp. G2MR2-5]